MRGRIADGERIELFTIRTPLVLIAFLLRSQLQPHVGQSDADSLPGPGSRGRVGVSGSEGVWASGEIWGVADIIISLLKMRKFIGFCRQRGIDAKIFTRRSARNAQRSGSAAVGRDTGHPLTSSLDTS